MAKSTSDYYENIPVKKSSGTKKLLKAFRDKWDIASYDRAIEILLSNHNMKKE